MSDPPKRARSRWLRWSGLFMLAVVLVVAAMVIYCVSTPAQLAVQAGAAVVLYGLIHLVSRDAARSVRRLLRSLIPFLPLALAAVVIHANVTAVWASRGRIFSEIDRVPPTEVGLVFGTTDRVGGRENLYFRYRVEAAAALWKADKVETLIVSGDNRSMNYNEPRKLTLALAAHGVPVGRIVQDYAGLRTLDSVVRAKEIFGADSVVFISQRFQAERAIYLAKANGIDAYGFEARDVQTPSGFRTRLREVGARVKMWLDVNFLDTRPRHLGEKVPMPE